MSGLQGLIDIAFYAIVGLALSIAGFFFVMGVISYMGAGGAFVMNTPNSCAWELRRTFAGKLPLGYALLRLRVSAEKIVKRRFRWSRGRKRPQR